MRLGARWRVGDPPHPGVPEELHAEIATQDAAHPGAGSWTLTWLEGRPRCALDGLLVVTLSPDGDVVLDALSSEGAGEDEDDDWLE